MPKETTTTIRGREITTRIYRTSQGASIEVSSGHEPQDVATYSITRFGKTKPSRIAPFQRNSAGKRDYLRMVAELGLGKNELLID